MYANCKFCSAKLKYKQNNDEEGFKLVFMRNKHKHKILNKNDIIKKFIRSLPSNLNIGSIKKLIKWHFGISDSKFYYLYRKCY